MMDTQTNPECEAAHGTEGGVLASLLTRSPEIFSLYKKQLFTSQSLLKEELKLTALCLGLILGCLVLLLIVGLSVWVGLNILGAYLMLSAQYPVWSIVVGLASFHLLTAALVVQSVRRLGKEMKFEGLFAGLGS